MSGKNLSLIVIVLVVVAIGAFVSISPKKPSRRITAPGETKGSVAESAPAPGSPQSSFTKPNPEVNAEPPERAVASLSESERAVIRDAVVSRKEALRSRKAALHEKLLTFAKGTRLSNGGVEYLVLDNLSAVPDPKAPPSGAKVIGRVNGWTVFETFPGLTELPVVYDPKHHRLGVVSDVIRVEIVNDGQIRNVTNDLDLTVVDSFPELGAHFVRGLKPTLAELTRTVTILEAHSQVKDASLEILFAGRVAR